MDYGCNSRRCRGRSNGLNNFSLRRELHRSVYQVMGGGFAPSIPRHGIECVSQDLAIEVSMNTDDLPQHSDYGSSNVYS